MTFGNDFSFVGNQYHLEIYGEEFFPNLIFFNRELNALVVVELKIGYFKPSYLGQLTTPADGCVLFTLLPVSDELPHFYEFHSPIKNVEKIKGVYNKTFFKQQIIISHEPDDVSIPLYFSADKHRITLKERNLRGVIYLIGQVAELK